MMKKSILFSFLLAVAFCQCQPTQQQAPDQKTTKEQAPAPPYQDLSVSEFKAKMNTANVVVLDVRTPAETAEGKIDGAMEIDYHADGFAEKIIALDKEKTYLVYCRSGNRSGKTCKMMAGKGFKKLYNLEGGFMAWSAKD